MSSVVNYYKNKDKLEKALKLLNKLTDFKFSSGKIKYLFNTLIYKMIQNFAPDVIILSYNFGYNKNITRQYQSQISLNVKKITEIF